MKNSTLILVVICCALLAAALGCSPPGASTSCEPVYYRSTVEAQNVEFSGVAADLRAALINPDFLVRAAKTGEILQKLGPDSAEQVLEVFETVWMDLGQTELMLLADWWARFDPHAALEWAESDFRTSRTNTPLVVFQAWARNDPRAAIARALEGRPDNPKMRNAYEASVIEGWSESGKPGVMEYVQGLGANTDRQIALVGIARRMVMREGVAASFAWADDLPEADKVFRLNALRRVATYAAIVDPVATASFAEKYDGTYYMRSLPQRVAMKWAEQDPHAMMNWLRTLEPGRDRDEGVREGFRIWVRRDNEAALAWLSDGPHDRFKDEALALYLRRSQLGDPETALRRTEEIIDEALRLSTQTIITRTWAVQDEDEAKEWVENESGMTDAEKERALFVGRRHRSARLSAMERFQQLDEPSAKARLEDWSDPDIIPDEEERIRKLRTIENPSANLR